MEMIVILAAGAALVFAGLVVVFAHGRRPPLRLPHEQELEDRGDELFRDFDRDLAGALEQAAQRPELHAAPERLQAPDTPRFRPQGRLTIDHDPAEPGLAAPAPRDPERDGESR